MFGQLKKLGKKTTQGKSGRHCEVIVMQECAGFPKYAAPQEDLEETGVPREKISIAGVNNQQRLRLVINCIQSHLFKC